MKVLIINGSPKRDGNTYTALAEVEQLLHAEGMETEWFHLGTDAVHGCIDCKHCMKAKRCIFEDDACNALIEAMVEADGVLVGSPVYYAGPNGALCALFDRVFYAAAQWHQLFAGKPAAALVTRYRSGGCASIDRLNKYFSSSQMPIVSTIDYQEFPEIKRKGISKVDQAALNSLAENLITALNLKRADQ